jgi:Holliday junction resolvase RusA-like endonuclease
MSTELETKKPETKTEEMQERKDVVETLHKTIGTFYVKNIRARNRKSDLLSDLGEEIAAETAAIKTVKKKIADTKTLLGEATTLEEYRTLKASLDNYADELADAVTKKEQALVNFPQETMLVREFGKTAAITTKAMNDLATPFILSLPVMTDEEMWQLRKDAQYFVRKLK